MILDLNKKSIEKLFDLKISARLEKDYSDLKYKLNVLNRSDREKLYTYILKNIDSNNFQASGNNRSNDWENGWNENYLEYSNTFNNDLLIPKYYKKDSILRLNGEYVSPKESNFKLSITKVFFEAIFENWLYEFDCIHDFGCGTGWHLLRFSQKDKTKKYYGYDWVDSSQKIINTIAKQNNIDLFGFKFDFTNPNYEIEFPNNSVVYTFGALEQIGAKWNNFLNFLLEKKPRLIINIEPLEELYDQNLFFDFIAYKYHKKRNYLSGYLTKLRELEKSKLINILKIHKKCFGDMYNDTHSYVIWKIK